MSDFNYTFSSGFLVLRNFLRRKAVCWSPSNLIFLYMTYSVFHILTLTSLSGLLSHFSTQNKTEVLICIESMYVYIFVYLITHCLFFFFLWNALSSLVFWNIIIVIWLSSLNRHFLEVLLTLSPIEFEVYALVYKQLSYISGIVLGLSAY